MIICDDFNIDLKNCNICKKCRNIFGKCHELGCTPMINRPTRIDLNKNYFSIIDNFLQIFIVLNILACVIYNIIISDLSDHFPVILSLVINKISRLYIVNKYNTKYNLINDDTVYHFSNLSTEMFFKLII